jgi:hypothetical protein
MVVPNLKLGSCSLQRHSSFTFHQTKALRGIVIESRAVSHDLPGFLLFIQGFSKLW